MTRFPRLFPRPLRLRLGAAAALVLGLAGVAQGQSTAFAPQGSPGPDTMALKGLEIVRRTSAFVGPDVPDATKRYAGNNLACTDCHLQAGTQRFALPLYGLRDLFPHYNARTGDAISLADRVNACFTRSLNGKAMPEDAPEMKALVAYLDYLSTGMSNGKIPPDQGAGHISWLTRPADPKRGEPIYAATCAMCHGKKGEGIRWSAVVKDRGYMIPPLWGKDSFNDGAGMARLITMANFVHSNMPHGTDYWSPNLKVDEAWDVAAYVLSQPRPKKKGLDKDFPDLLLKPVDVPYGPYADEFSEEEHKFGPFGPIARRIVALKNEARLKARQKEIQELQNAQRQQQQQQAPQDLTPQPGAAQQPTGLQ
ncbi:c-type cytochrome [Segnochrobactrum spirostomi]|uniref:C-type cytochrome n=1 Tax=Segnochrobactrum spirostomi TaxID=2608987 RepID=A0A6A7XXJ5_9HYPH|nr:c-type cytochrome [Segnochrobactrum spirostomi]MQT11380.1 c-type cytochrome [Segnochrobactrum spirostomi]